MRKTLLVVASVFTLITTAANAKCTEAQREHCKYTPHCRGHSALGPCDVFVEICLNQCGDKVVSEPQKKPVFRHGQRE
jgi:hypothetical protein